MRINKPNQVFLDDCMNVMRRYPDGYFDRAYVDIPYGIGVGKMAYLTDRNKTIKQKNGTRMTVRGYKDLGHTKKNWDNEPPGQDYFNELKRVSRHQIIFGIDYVKWEGVGPGKIMWNKGVAEGASFKTYETAYCSMIDHIVELPLLWSGMMQAVSLQQPMTQQGNKRLNEKRIHPCHKPVMLYQKLYMDYGFEGMKILDTHCGSGSSRIAAWDFNYEYVGAEIDEEYFQKQEQRFQEYSRHQRLAYPV